MAQRRSRNRRLSTRRSSNASGFLDDNTNIIDNNDPQWYNRTIVRPSTSFILTKNASSILNPDSMVDETQSTGNWYNNLSRSETSKLMEEIVKKKVNDGKNESGNSTRVEPVTESESETESKRKRTKLRVNQNKVNISDKSNVFSRALEKTTESHTKNLTVHIPEGNESESTNDDSRTMKRTKPTLFRNNKRSKEDISNYDDLFNSDSTNENIQTSKRNSRSSLKRKSKDLIEHTSTPVVGQKFKKNQLEKLLEVNSTELEKSAKASVNTTWDNTLPVTPVKELRNRSIVRMSINKTPTKSSQKQVGSTTVYDAVEMSLTMIENKSQKRKPTLFSQKSKSSSDVNSFNEVFENDNEPNPNSENQLIIGRSSKTQEQNADETNKDHENNESETSSIPKYIRRTRSVILRKSSNEFEDKDVFEKQSENQGSQRETNDDENEASCQASKHSQDHNVSWRSLEDTQDIIKLQNLSKSRNKSSNNRSRNIVNRTAHNRSLEEKKNESSSSSEIIKTKSRILDESSDDEDMVDISIFPKATNSQSMKTNSFSQFHAQKSIKISDQSKNLSKTSRKSKSALNIDDNNDEHIDNERGNTITPEITNKSRSRLLRSRTRISDGENAFDKILDTENSTALEKSESINVQRSLRSSQSKKSTQIVNDTRTSLRSTKDLVLNQSKNNSEANKSVTNESAQNNSQQEESEDETSTIPNHIRRTRSRLFQRSEVVEDNAFDDVLNDENSGAKQSSEINRNQSQNSLKLKLSVSQDSNRTLNRSTSQLREFRRPNSQAFKKPQEFLQAVLSPKASSDSANESLKENQDTNKSQNSRSRKSSVSLNKNKEVINESGQLNIEKSKQQSPQKSTTSDVNIEENVATEGAQNQQSSVETSSDGTPKVTLNENRTIPHIPEKSINEDYLSDDLLHTPNPAQSTLKISGKPVTRITQFSFRNSVINETESPQSPTLSNHGPSLPPTDPKIIIDRIEESQKEEEQDDEENEDDDIDVINDSDTSEYPLLTRASNDIPHEAEKSSFEEEAAPFLSTEPSTSKATKTQIEDNISTIDESVWVQVKKRTDALKIIMETQKKQQEAIQREREGEKAKTEAKLKRVLAQREAELKKQHKKPIDKAYYVNGKLYKQPRLPVPKQWVTDRLYKYLWKHMEPKFGLNTRVQSEKFIMKLSNIFTVITRRKKYENYKDEVDDLLISMAKLGIIKDRYDFYGFCREFMPYSFRIKVVPMQLPGNQRNIPYEPELVHKPILPDRSGSYESQSNSDNNSDSNSDSNSKSNDQDNSESASESE